MIEALQALRGVAKLSAVTIVAEVGRLSRFDKPRQLMGPVVDFLGRQTEFVGGPGAVASKTGCAVIGVYCTRLAPFTYRFEVDELFPPADEDSPRRDAQEITAL